MTTSSLLTLPPSTQNPFLRYLALGWSVIPLQAKGKLPESRLLPQVEDEVDPDKRKRSWKPYQTSAPTTEQVDIWWRNPSLNVGIVTGQVSGIVVLDLDNPTAIRTAYDWGIPQTPTVATGKGLHLYFRAPEQVIGNRANFASVEGFDFRGEGGYVVAPPSLHPEGRTYEWLHSPEDVPLAEMPKWLQTLLLPEAMSTLNTPVPEVDQGAPRPNLPPIGENAERSKYRYAAEQTIRMELEHLAETRKGERNDQLNRSAFRLGQLIAVGDADETEIQNRLLAVAQDLGLSRHEAQATIASGLRAGKQQPRTWAPDPPSSEAGQKQESQVSALIRLGETATLFHSPQGDRYARYPVGNRYDTHQIGHPRTPFALWLQRQFYLERGTPAAYYSVQQALTHLEQVALYVGEEHRVFTRLGHVDDTVYLALGDKQGHIVELDRSGWRLTQEAPVIFRSTRNAEALPLPERGGQLEALRPLLNLPSESAWQLCVGWMIGALNPRGPYAHLALYGEQGSGKSSLLRTLRHFVDPAYAAENAEPGSVDDLMVTAVNSHILSYDNLSNLGSDFNEWLCRLSTGAGLIRRKLYSDEEEVVLKAARPVILNGIVPLVQRPDLLERTIVVELPRIEPSRRMPERAFERELARIAPGVLGALLDAVVVALQRIDSVEVPLLPRMADFTLWVEAAAPSLGWKGGEFVTTYKANTATKEVQSLEADEVAETLVAWSRYKLPQVGDELPVTLKQLLSELSALRLAGNDPTRIASVAPTTRMPPEWPDSGKALLIRLAQAQPLLRQWGVEYERGIRKLYGQLYVVRRVSGEGASTDTP